MCTVSFVNAHKKIIITSNRDEKTLRAAVEPQKYLINNIEVTFPKDPQSGGTWYAVTDTTILVLLNGASEKHIPKPPYRRSRGLIVLDLIGTTNVLQSWNAIDLENIEPFTLVYFHDNQLYQFRWNGFSKESIELDISKNHIWSSSTLYSQEIRTQRQEWFGKFLSKKAILSEEDLYHFHRYTESENTQNGLIINRNNELKTLSITQAVVEENQIKLSHHDLVNEKVTP
jgi:uncharacterized protein with NRDE domain